MRWLTILFWFWSYYAAGCEIKFDESFRAFESYSTLFTYVKKEVLPVSVNTDTEYVGLIYAHEGNLHTLTAQGCPGEDQFSFKLKRNSKLVGVWHTHGAPGHLREAFSPQDAILVQTLELPLYLITPSGSVRMLDLANAKESPQRLAERGSIITALGYSGSSLMFATNR